MPVCKPTCCAFCAFCAFRYFNYARASGGTCSACSAFCARYLVYACCARCARSTRFQNFTCNTVGHKSAPPAKDVQIVDKGTYICIYIMHIYTTTRRERLLIRAVRVQVHAMLGEDWDVGPVPRQRRSLELICHAAAAEPHAGPELFAQAALWDMRRQGLSLRHLQCGFTTCLFACWNSCLPGARPWQLCFRRDVR